MSDVRQRFYGMDRDVLDFLKERFGTRLNYIEQDGGSLGTKPVHLPPFELEVA